MKFWFSNKYVQANFSWWTVKKPATVRELLIDLPYAEEIKVRKPMEKELILKFHTRYYIQRLESGSEEALGFEWTREMYECSRYRAQGQLEAADYAIGNKTATFNLACGFHHAESNSARGYCTLNGLVLAHIALKEKYPKLKTAVLDLDAHFGNGCDQFAKSDDEKSFTYLDMSLRLGHNDFTNYMSRLEWCLDKLRFFEPDLIEVNGGMDVLLGDTVGHGILTLNEVGERDAVVYEFAKGNGYPLVMCLAGGYQDDAITGHVNSFKKAANIWR